MRLAPLHFAAAPSSAVQDDNGIAVTDWVILACDGAVIMTARFYGNETLSPRIFRVDFPERFVKVAL